MRRWHPAVLISLALLLGGGTLAFVVQVLDGNVEQTDKRAELAEDVATETRRDTAKKDKQLGRRILVVRREQIRTRVIVRQTRTVLREIGVLGPRGERGPLPTPAQVLDAVLRVCARGLCRPTSEQLTTAFAAICGEDRCRGRDGKDGTPGRDGTNGADGVNGAPGRDGMNGVDGAPGPAGPVVPCAQLDPALGYQCVPPPAPPPA